MDRTLSLIFLMGYLLREITSQGTLQWTSTFPTGYQLLSGDNIRMPLDGYVNLPGASFQTATAATTAMQIQSRLSLQQTVDLQESSMQNCNLAISYNDMFYMVCDNYYFYIIRYTVPFVKNSLSVRMYPMDASGIGIGQGTQSCTQIRICTITGYAYVLCRKITDANEDVVLYRTPNGYSYTGTATGNMYYKGCQNTGWVKGDLRLGYANSYNSLQYTAAIYSATIPVGQPPLTALNILLCRGDFTVINSWSNQVLKYNLKTVVSDPFLIGMIKSIAIYQGEAHAVFVSNENPPGNYSIALLPLYISAYASAIFREPNFITTYYNYSTTMNTHKILMNPVIGSYINSGMYLVDSSKLYYNTILARRDYVPYFYTISKIGNITYRLDCGLDSMTGTQEVVPYMMFPNDNNPSTSNSRITVVYRYLSNNTLYDYAFVISNTFDFICARPSGFGEGYAQHGFIHGYPPNSFYSSITNSIMSMYDINTLSYLRMKAEAVTGRYSIPVSASIGSKNQVSPQLFSYDVFARLADITGTSLPTTTVTTYPGYKLLLPFTAASF
jgi:hypothetical protein